MRREAVVFLAFALGCGGYGGGDGMYGDMQTTQPQQDQQPQQMMEGDMAEDQQMQDVVEINMTARQFEFVPSQIKVKNGTLVRIKIRSEDVLHGFAIDEFGVNKQVGQSETVIEFVADKTGTFTFYCSVYCGVGHSNMRGTLVVE